MEWLRHRGRKGPFGKALKGLVLLGLFLSVIGLASSVGLHKAFHPDASNPDHHCVVTLLSSGQVEITIGMAVVVSPAVAPITSVFLDPSFQAEVSFNLPLSRGPPALLS
jgi:hypothetical protein